MNEMSSLKKSYLIQYKGFTLIEILIALLIISISLTAALQATGLNLRNQQSLGVIIRANHIANNALRLSEVSFLQTGKVEGSYQTNDFNQTWYWRAKPKNSRCQNVKEIKIDILNQQFNAKSTRSIIGYGIFDGKP